VVRLLAYPRPQPNRCAERWTAEDLELRLFELSKKKERSEREAPLAACAETVNCPVAALGDAADYYGNRLP